MAVPFGTILAWMQSKGELPAAADLTMAVYYDDTARQITRWLLPGPMPDYETIAAREAEYLAATADERKTKSLDMGKKEMAAILLRLSARWSTTTAAEKNRVQAIIDAAGGKVLAAIRG